MATTITTTNTLGIGLEYYDPHDDRNKTVYVKVPNPKAELTEQAIKAAAVTLINGENPILLDKWGSPFDSNTAVETAYIENQERIEVDTGYED